MYIQDMFREERTEALHRFIRTYSLGTLVVGAPDLHAQPLPMEIVGDGLGIIRSHIARRNPISTTIASGTQALAIFHSPDAYISPRWYVNGQRSGRVAPSWNYMTVHAHGPIRFIDDAPWVMSHLTSLTQIHEAHRTSPWNIMNAPPDFISQTARHLVGLEIPVTSLEGKYFLSQQRTAADRQSIVQNLRMQPHGSAHDVAALIERNNPE